jgi:uncharacterized membrane protein YdjX (TVP38/TMEM64 family)
MALELMTFILPFLFVLAIVYGALDLAAVFKKKAVNVIIALVVAVFAVSNVAIVDSIVAAMPWAAMLFIILFFIKFILSFFKTEKGKEKDYTLIIIILALIAIFMLSQGTQLIQDWLPGGFPVSEENLILIIGIVIIVAILYAAYNASKNR